MRCIAGGGITFFFHPVMEPEEITFIHNPAPKHFELDHILLLKFLSETVLAIVINTSLTSSIFPSLCWTSIVKPFLKNPTLDLNDFKAFILFLTFPSSPRLLKRMLPQISDHLNQNDLFIQHDLHTVKRPPHSHWHHHTLYMYSHYL